jgi:hypothetical protein
MDSRVRKKGDGMITEQNGFSINDLTQIYIKGNNLIALFIIKVITIFDAKFEELIV